MCGLFGWISFEEELGERHLKASRKALASLAHRGPDNQGEWRDGRVYIGHRRLSILDLSAAANQPFTDPDERYVLSYNGEIYNYVELRDELESAGVRFSTSSDTEVVLAALIRWGRAALTRFDGMFALAFYDRASGRTLLARDPLGQKPLYYHAFDRGLVYGSELSALLLLDGFSWRIDKSAFRRFLVNSFYAWDQTPIVGVKKLLPGCCLEVKGSGVTLERYWDSVPGSDVLDIDAEAAIGEFERLFDLSCKRSMRSDVPYGVFLSGGIDSSLILSSCHAANSSVRSFCVAMGDPDFDESSKAETIVRHLGVASHHTFDMNQDSVEQALEGFFNASHEPHGDPGFVNTYFLAQSARPHLTVALGGDGGDELFSGYAPFAGLAAVPWLKSLPPSVMGLSKRLARLIPANDTYLGLQFKLGAYLQGFPADDATRLALWLSSVTPDEFASLCPQVKDEEREPGGAPKSVFDCVRDIMAPAEGRTLQQMMLYYYQKVFLPEFVCMHTDRAAMQFGLEVRSPFLSLPLIEFANRLPDHLRMRNGQLKWLLKQVVARRGFPAVIRNQKKQGFTFPIARWLKTTLRPQMDRLLAPNDLDTRLVDPSRVDWYRAQHLEGRRNNYRMLFNLMAFQRWRQKYPSLDVA